MGYCVVGLLGCWVLLWWAVVLLGCWLVGLLGHSVVGLLSCCVVGLLCCVAGLLVCLVVGVLGCQLAGWLFACAASCLACRWLHARAARGASSARDRPRPPATIPRQAPPPHTGTSLRDRSATVLGALRPLVHRILAWFPYGSRSLQICRDYGLFLATGCGE